MILSGNYLKNRDKTNKVDLIWDNRSFWSRLSFEIQDQKTARKKLFFSEKNTENIVAITAVVQVMQPITSDDVL